MSSPSGNPPAVEVAKLAYQCRLAEQAEQFGDMCDFAEQMLGVRVSALNEAPTLDEVKLFATAFKNLVAPVRRAFRIAQAGVERYTTKKVDPRKSGPTEAYMRNCVSEIQKICSRVENLILKIKPMTTGGSCPPEVTALVLKTEADYLRYKVEIGAADKDSARGAYEAATEAARQLPAGNSVRLGVALNYAVFLEEVSRDPDGAIRTVNAALSAAESEGIENSREATLVERLLRDNLDLWSVENQKSTLLAAN